MNYKFFPENLIELRYEDSISWLVVNIKDWKENLIVGPTFSAFSVAILYCLEHPSKNFVITAE